jgi:adenylate kinase family enzyme
VQRVAIVGPGGAGKSTFADELGRRTGISVVHLDQYFWKPNWIPTPGEKWVDLQFELFSGDRWIADGNYGGTLDVRLSRADTVIVVTLPRWQCTWRAFKRGLPTPWRSDSSEGCPERLDLKFLLWVWRYPIDSRPRLDRATDRFRDRLNVVELASTSAAQSFLDELT